MTTRRGVQRARLTCNPAKKLADLVYRETG
jgi:hypothetical protein